MSSVAYDNMSFEEDDDNLDDNFLERLQHDSLDVNVLNCANLNTITRSEDDGYAGSTLRVGSSMNKTLMNMPANSKKFHYISDFATRWRCSTKLYHQVALVPKFTSRWLFSTKLRHQGTF
jgi:hypothetical protein